MRTSIANIDEIKKISVQLMPMRGFREVGKHQKVHLTQVRIMKIYANEVTY